MAKESGIAWTTCSVDASDTSVEVLKNDVTSLTISTPRAEQDVTGLDKSAHERLLLLADVSIGLTGVFNPAAANSHAAFGDCSTTSVLRTVTLTVSSQNLATPSAPEMFVMDYSLSRGADGSFTWTVPLLLGDGVAAAWA